MVVGTSFVVSPLPTIDTRIHIGCLHSLPDGGLRGHSLVVFLRAIAVDLAPRNSHTFMKGTGKKGIGKKGVGHVLTMPNRPRF